MKPLLEIIVAALVVSAVAATTFSAQDTPPKKMQQMQPVPAPPPPARKATQRMTTPSSAPAPNRSASSTSSGSRFAPDAFPPTLSDTPYHENAWRRNDCLRCHETGVQDAPRVRHKGMPDVLLSAKCRSCHVLIPGQPASQPRADEDSRFAPFAFPPMIPASESHRRAWTKDDCILCHQNGISGAPSIKHAGMPDVLLEAKCRSCHVQVRATTFLGEP
ncbi:MAG: hypothetical protein D6744_13350 [Planctomycetota bacterium]|nr:MAG: hypothetical protein D6744_13350 [Planctomycetota bacterium]